MTSKSKSNKRGVRPCGGTEPSVQPPSQVAAPHPPKENSRRNERQGRPHSGQSKDREGHDSSKRDGGKRHSKKHGHHSGPPPDGAPNVKPGTVWSGSSFHSSPAASSLPKPTFPSTSPGMVDKPLQVMGPPSQADNGRPTPTSPSAQRASGPANMPFVAPQPYMYPPPPFGGFMGPSGVPNGMFGANPTAPGMAMAPPPPGGMSHMMMFPPHYPVMAPMGYGPVPPSAAVPTQAVDSPQRQHV